MNPYGFVVTAALGDLASEVSAEHKVKRFSSKTIEVVSNHYACTPESVGEQQPLICGDLLVVYDGRLDDREELVAELQPLSRQVSDGELLAAAYRRFGSRITAKVIGEFSFAVVDRVKNLIVAGADSLGVRRLYYKQVGSRIWITSNLGVLFEKSSCTRPDIDNDVLEEYFAGVMTPWSGRSIWRGIREVGRGKTLLCSGRQVTEVTTWTPRETQHSFRSSEEVDLAFRELLFKTVRNAARSPGPLLVDLSGGYDSSTVCCVAASLYEREARRRTVVPWSYLNQRFTEGGYQESVCNRYDLQSLVLDINEHLPFQAFNDTEIPSFGFIQFGAVDRAVREFARARGVHSRLTGYAADALFNKSASPVYLSDWFRSMRLADWLRDFRAYVNGGSYSAWRLIRDCTIGSLDIYAGGPRPTPPTWLTARFRSRIAERNRDFVAAYPRTFSSNARELVYRLTLWFMPPHGRIIPDERMPFVSRPLVEFVLGLDWQFITKPNENRLLLRRSLRDILPEEMQFRAGRTDHGVPIVDGLREAWPRVSPMVSGSFLGALGVVDEQEFQKGIRKLRAGFSGLEPRYMHTALYLETWLSYKSGVRPV